MPLIWSLFVLVCNFDLHVTVSHLTESTVSTGLYSFQTLHLFSMRGQRRILGRWFSPSTMCVLKTELRSSGLATKILYWPSYLADPFVFLREQYPILGSPSNYLQIFMTRTCHWLLSLTLKLSVASLPSLLQACSSGITMVMVGTVPDIGDE